MSKDKPFNKEDVKHCEARDKFVNGACQSYCSVADCDNSSPGEK